MGTDCGGTVCDELKFRQIRHKERLDSKEFKKIHHNILQNSSKMYTLKIQAISLENPIKQIRLSFIRTWLKQKEESIEDEKAEMDRMAALRRNAGGHAPYAGTGRE